MKKNGRPPGGMLRNVLMTSAPDAGQAQPTASPWALRVRYLARLRWHAVIGHAAAVVVAVRWLHVALPVLPLAVLVGLLAASNVALLALTRAGRVESARALTATLFFDTLLFTAVLYLTGGTANPFTSLYFIEITLAAILVDRWRTAALTLLSLACYAFLYLRAPRLAGAFGQVAWVAFVLVAWVLGDIVARLASALREQQTAFAQAERSAARTEKLAALGTLAAGVAHELNTPLGSIAVAAGELMQLVPERDSEAREEVQAIRGEIERCRAVLQRLAGRVGQTVGEAPEVTTPSAVLAALRRRFDDPRLEVRVTADHSFWTPTRGLLEVLGNLVTNALQASGGRQVPVVVDAGVSGQSVRFEIRDRGAGVPERLMQRMGEPFFTTKPTGEGMGLGLFLGRSFAEACGGTLVFESEEGLGSVVTLELPRTLGGRA